MMLSKGTGYVSRRREAAKTAGNTVRLYINKYGIIFVK